MGSLPMRTDPQPGYRGRFDGPPFEEIPPSVEPPVPGFETSPFEKPSFGPSGPLERDRISGSGYRDGYRPPQYADGPAGYRDMPIPAAPNEISVHIPNQPPRYRDNYRPGHSYRDQGPAPFRDGAQSYRDSGPPGLPYREGNFRGGQPPSFRDNSYRNMPFRDGNYRDPVPHNFRDPNVPYRPPSADPREPIPPNYHDPNYRESFRDETNANRDAMRAGYRANARSRGGSRRNPNVEHEKHRDARERERLNENREPPPEKGERSRDADKRQAYEKREVRDERTRDTERNREYDKERGRDKATPDKKGRSSPKRTREKKRSESRGRSRDRDRDRENRREKKDDRSRERPSSERGRDHKDKEKKIKDRKKKKREKEKDNKKKRDKKEKKEKESTKKDDDDKEKTENVDSQTENKELVKQEPKEEESVQNNIVQTEPAVAKVIKADATESVVEKSNEDLYGDESAEAVDKEIIQNYVKTENKEQQPIEVQTEETSNKDDPFDGIELQAVTEDLEADIEGNTGQSKEMLAPLPELSKWEVDDDNAEKTKEPGEITSPEEEEDSGKVTSEVIKRAENAIFAKAISSLRPIEIKKISSDRLKLYGDEMEQKNSMNNIQITVPVVDSNQRSIELSDRNRYSKTPPPRLSVKERLGGKVEDVRKSREMRLVQSTVERVKSRSKTPKREQAYRRVTVEKEKENKPRSHGRSQPNKSDRRADKEDRNSDSYRGGGDSKKKDFDRSTKHDKKSNVDDNFGSRHRDRGNDNSNDIKRSNAERERKKSILDEAHFEPDYDETLESDNETKEESSKKRGRSASPSAVGEAKKAKLEDTIKLDLTNVKKKPESESESSSESDGSSSSSSSDARRRKKKKKRNKKKKKRAASDSDSDSDSSSDDHKKKKKKRKHKKRSNKKKKKSKHNK